MARAIPKFRPLCFKACSRGRLSNGSRLEQNPMTAWYPPNFIEDLQVREDLQEAQSELSLRSLKQQAYANFVRAAWASCMPNMTRCWIVAFLCRSFHCAASCYIPTWPRSSRGTYRGKSSRASRQSTTQLSSICQELRLHWSGAQNLFISVLGSSRV